MTAIIQPGQIRRLLFGSSLERATAALPQSTAGTLYTVTGGRIIMTGILGEVTTAIQNQACNTKLQSVPTAGSTVDLCATVDVAALEAGGFLGLTPDLDSGPFSVAMSKQLAGGIPYGMPGGGIVIPAGAIKLSCSASNTGSVKWIITYVPLDDSASVAAA